MEKNIKNAIVVTHEGDEFAYDATLSRGCAETTKFAGASSRQIPLGGISVVFGSYSEKPSKTALKTVIQILQKELESHE